MARVKRLFERADWPDTHPLECWPWTLILRLLRLDPRDANGLDRPPTFPSPLDHGIPDVDPVSMCSYAGDRSRAWAHFAHLTTCFHERFPVRQ